MKVIELARVSATGQTEIDLGAAGYSNHPECILQLEFTGTATAALNGGVKTGGPWTEIFASGSADVGSPAALWPLLQLDVTAYTSGDIILTGAFSPGT